MLKLHMEEGTKLLMKLAEFTNRNRVTSPVKSSSLFLEGFAFCSSSSSSSVSFFIAKPLKASLTSVAVRNLRYNNNNNNNTSSSSSSSSSSLYFNATLAMEVRIDNPNQGVFEFPISKGDILYNGHVVGEMRINGQRVASFGTIRTEVRTEVGYKGNQTSPVWLKNDIERRLIILTTRAKLRGEVHLKALNKRTVNLKCLMHLNLIDEVIHRWWCK